MVETPCIKVHLDFRFPGPKLATDPISNLIIGQVFTHKNVLLHHSIIFSKLGACAETISTWLVILFTISRFLIFKSATDPISIENSLSAEIGQVTDFRGLKSDWWPILVMEIGSLNGPLFCKPVFHIKLFFFNKVEQNRNCILKILKRCLMLLGHTHTMTRHFFAQLNQFNETIIQL